MEVQTVGLKYFAIKAGVFSTTSSLCPCKTPEFARLTNTSGVTGYPLGLLTMLLIHQPFAAVERKPLLELMVGK